MTTAAEIISALNLSPHPKENGHFRPIPRLTSSKCVKDDVPCLDAAYFLYEFGEIAPLHRMKTSEEFWIHQSGGTLEVRDRSLSQCQCGVFLAYQGFSDCD